MTSNQAGSEALLGLVAQRAPGRRCWAVEDTGSYAAGLASFLADRGEWVTEIDRSKRPAAVMAPRATRWTRSGPAGEHDRQRRPFGLGAARVLALAAPVAGQLLTRLLGAVKRRSA